MSLEFAIICDHDACERDLQVEFDRPDDTLREVICAARELGWVVFDDRHGMPLLIFCTDHRVQFKLELVDGGTAPRTAPRAALRLLGGETEGT